MTEPITERQKTEDGGKRSRALRRLLRLFDVADAALFLGALALIRAGFLLAEPLGWMVAGILLIVFGLTYASSQARRPGGSSQ